MTYPAGRQRQRARNNVNLKKPRKNRFCAKKQDVSEKLQLFSKVWGQMPQVHIIFSNASLSRPLFNARL